MKRPNLQTIDIDEGEEFQVDLIDQIFNKPQKKTSPKLRKRHIHSNIRSIQNRKYTRSERHSPQSIRGKTLNLQKKK